jgi:hypothetical protein
MVLALHNGPLSRAQREWAAVLSSGVGAALGGRTALALTGLQGWEVEEVHLLVPRGHRPPRFRIVPTVLHETRWPADGQIETFGPPARTLAARSAIDAAIWSTSPRTACGVLAAVVQQRLTTPQRLLEVLSEAGPVRHRRAMMLALGDIAGGAQALTEIDFHRLCRRYNLGKVTGQRIRLDDSGLRRYMDGEIESPYGGRVSFEIDGALHLVERSYWRDMSRNNELLIVGEAQLRFPAIAYRLDEAKVVDQLRRALAAADLRLAQRRHRPEAS